MSFYFSKSKYTTAFQCPKILWLREHKPEEEEPLSEQEQEILDNGNAVGDLAMGIFGDYVEVTAHRADDPDRLDYAEMIRRTQAEMAKGTENICEASFSYDGLYCAVDILRRENGGWAIYEVKSASHRKDINIEDISYQKYVLEHCGVNVTGVYLVYLNSEYYRRGELDLKQLFVIEDVSTDVNNEIQNVEPVLEQTKQTLSMLDEPEKALSADCFTPYTCRFRNYCWRHLPEHSVFNLYRMNTADKINYYNSGIISFADVANCTAIMHKTTASAKIIALQLETEGSDREIIDKDGIRDFLDTLYYPLYFLDFESMQPAVPLYDGTKPYMQIPTQYSLHYIEKEGAELKHKEFLAESGPDPRRAIAEKLCEDIPYGACVTAFNKSFEYTRIKELAEAFPDLRDHLLDMNANMKDFLDPFRAGYYYKDAFGGSFSIKSVLPGLFPDDPELDYHALEGVHNGGEAKTIFPKIKDMSPEEREITRRNLLKYCELDTYAMVKIWQRLVEVSE